MGQVASLPEALPESEDLTGDTHGPWQLASNFELASGTGLQSHWPARTWDWSSPTGIQLELASRTSTFELGYAAGAQAAQILADNGWACSPTQPDSTPTAAQLSLQPDPAVQPGQLPDSSPAAARQQPSSPVAATAAVTAARQQPPSSGARQQPHSSATAMQLGARPKVIARPKPSAKARYQVAAT